MTLVESMVAVVIFGIVIVGLAGLALSSREASDRARSHYVAVNIANNRLERGWAMEFGEIENLNEDKVVVGVNGSPSASGRFRRTTTVTPVSSNLLEMVVVVEIKNRITLAYDGANETVQSYYADYLNPPDP